MLILLKSDPKSDPKCKPMWTQVLIFVIYRPWHKIQPFFYNTPNNRTLLIHAIILLYSKRAYAFFLFLSADLLLFEKLENISKNI